MKSLLSRKVSDHFMLHKVKNRKLSVYKETSVNVVFMTKEKAFNLLILQSPKPKDTTKYLRRGKHTQVFSQSCVFNNREICKNHNYFLLVVLYKKDFFILEVKSCF